MNEKENLHKIYEHVYQEKIPQAEKFMEKYDKHDDRLIEETACAAESGGDCAPENVIVVNGKHTKALNEAVDERDQAKLDAITADTWGDGPCPNCGEEMFDGHCEYCEEDPYIDPDDDDDEGECPNCGEIDLLDPETGLCQQCARDEFDDDEFEAESKDAFGLEGRTTDDFNCLRCGADMDPNDDECEVCGWVEGEDDPEDVDDLYDEDGDPITDGEFDIPPMGDENSWMNPDQKAMFEEEQAAHGIKERLELRKQINEHLFEAIDNKRLREELEDDKSPTNLVRYELQKFTNGGTPTADGGIDGEVGGPSSYEAWRYGINDKKRKARAEQENADRDSPFASPRTTGNPDQKMLDGQIDDFLLWHMKKYGGK